MDRKIEIKYMSDVFHCPLTDKETLPAEVLKKYFPAADGLTFEKNNVKNIVPIKNGEFLIDKYCDEYNVYVNNNMNAEDQRMNHLLQRIRNQHPNENSKKNDGLKKIQNKSKEAKKVGINSRNREYQQRFGWLRRTNGGAVSQVKFPPGGIIHLNLEENVCYSVKDLIGLAKVKYCKNGGLFQATARFKLGNFQGEVIDSFKIEDEECDFLEYRKHMINKKSSRLFTVYLIEETSLKRIGSPLTADSINPSSTINHCATSLPKKRLPLSPLKKNLYTHKIDNNSRSFIRSNKFDDRSELDHSSSVKLLGNFSSNIKTINSGNKTNYLADEKKSNLFADKDLKSTNQTFQSSKIHLSKKKSCDSNKIEIKYTLREKLSNGAYSSLELDKYHIHCLKFESLEYDDFDPIDFGYKISKIVLNNQILIQISFDEKMNRECVSFPTYRASNIEHNVLYDIPILNGYCEGKYGIGVITSCRKSCTAIFKWFKNNVAQFEGPFLYWIYINESEKNLWKCQVTCQIGEKEKHLEKKRVGACDTQLSIDLTSGKDANNSEQYVIDDRQDDNGGLGGEINDNCRLDDNDSEPHGNNGEDVADESFTIPKIDQGQFKFDSEELIGAGAQAKVYRGKFQGKSVAVKVLNIKKVKEKFVAREIDIYNAVKHMNVIEVLAVSLSTKSLYILMEFVDGKPLQDILDDDFIRSKFDLDDVKKKSIANQICDGINHLHTRKIPIIHRDIKPANIMITYNTCSVKIGDFSLSKFKKLLPSSACTTTGDGQFKGSPLYSAPEIVCLYLKDIKLYESFQPDSTVKLNESVYSDKSDIWSVACTLVELFNEEAVWDIPDNDEWIKTLKTFFYQKKIPKMTLVPVILQKKLKQSFSYIPRERPNVIELKT